MRVRTAQAVAALAIACPAAALPRFAARNGTECIQCHVNPTGGGMRNEYGRNVFEKAWLPLGGSTKVGLDEWIAPQAAPTGGDTAAEAGTDAALFSGNVTPWLALGGDFRTAYLLIEPERAAVAGEDRDITSSFFLMQADLYYAARLDRRATLVLDVGIYSGFEAWGLWQLRPSIHPWNLMLKVGRFMPPFGIREVEHQLFTREGIGLGNVDRDTGIEASYYQGPFAANLALVNGTVGDSAFDTHGSERRAFEKAVALRVAASRLRMGWIRGGPGLSLYFSQDAAQPNPMFGRSLLPDETTAAGEGLDELRAGGFVTLGLGRFAYVADFVWVRDDFYADPIATRQGYAAYQELSFLPLVGVDLVGTFEYMEPDVDLLHNTARRAAGIVELFPIPFVELRAMGRKTWDATSPTGGSWDVVLFAHLFM